VGASFSALLAGVIAVEVFDWRMPAA